MYRSLDAELIVQTCRSTHARVSDQFVGSGLSKVAGELLAVSEQAAALSAWLARPHVPLRALAWLGIGAILNEVENLTNGLSRKIWQKIMIFDRILAPANVSIESSRA